MVNVASHHVNEAQPMPLARAITRNGRALTDYDEATGLPGLHASNGRILYRLSTHALEEHKMEASLVVSNATTPKQPIPQHADHLPARFNKKVSVGFDLPFSRLMTDAESSSLVEKRRVRAIQEAHREAKANVPPHVVAKHIYESFNDPEIAPVAMPVMIFKKHHDATETPKYDVGLRSTTYAKTSRSSIYGEDQATLAARRLALSLVESAALGDLPQGNREEAETMESIEAAWDESYDGFVDDVDEGKADKVLGRREVQRLRSNISKDVPCGAEFCSEEQQHHCQCGGEHPPKHPTTPRFYCDQMAGKQALSHLLAREIVHLRNLMPLAVDVKWCQERAKAQGRGYAGTPVHSLDDALAAAATILDTFDSIIGEDAINASTTRVDA